jgi:DNA-binding transcriptional MerR regulator
MIKYSIADLENITGIKAHTIRIWEKRYNLITPFRTETNIRYYDNDQMKKLVNVASLIQSGMKISKVSKLSNDELLDEINKRLSDKAQTEASAYETYAGQLIKAGLEFDETSFNKVFANALLRYGMQSCYEKILIPLMNRVGMFWCTNHMNPAQEHFVSNLVKQKLHAVTDSLPPATTSHKPSLLFLPQNEDHEIGLLMSKYILRNAGRNVIYLGQRVPFDNLKSTVKQTKPGQLLFFLVQMHPVEQLQDYLDKVSDEFRDLKIFVSGFPYILSKLSIPNNITWIKSPTDFDKMLDD